MRIIFLTFIVRPALLAFFTFKTSKMKKNISTLLIILLVACQAFSQEAKQSVNGTNLENIVYPFPVSFLKLQIQNEELSMAYMDVRPV